MKNKIFAFEISHNDQRLRRWRHKTRSRITKGDISEILSGFQRDKKNKGYEIIKVIGWDYPSLITTYQNAEEISRSSHVPVLFHVKEPKDR